MVGVARVLELFSGIGGMRVAFRQASGSTALPLWRAMEVDETCCDTYAELFGSSVYKAIRAEQRWQYTSGPDELWRCSIDKLPDEAFEGADLWLLSPPCQPFTRTGKKMDVEDGRCAALMRLIDALPRLRQPPRALLLENLPEFIGSRAQGMWKRALARCGRALGTDFTIQEHTLNPVDFGYPNTRIRYYCIAVAHQQTPATEAGSIPSVDAPSLPTRPVCDFCSRGAAGPDEALQVPRDLLKLALANSWQLDVATGASLATKTFTSSYGKREYAAEGLSKAGPVLLTASDGRTPATVRRKRFMQLPQEDWERVRYFAPAEILAMQGYPEGWALPNKLSIRQQWRLIGNSINVDIVAHLLRRVLAALG